MKNLKITKEGHIMCEECGNHIVMWSHSDNRLLCNKCRRDKNGKMSSMSEGFENEKRI